MSDFDDRKAAYLIPATYRAFGVEAVYRRGEGSLPLRVKRSNGMDARFVGERTELRLGVDQEYVKILASGLDFGSGAVDPQAGDVIEITGERFRLMEGELPRPLGHGGGREWLLRMTQITE